MAIKIRKKKIAQGKHSLYLDMYVNGRRRYEFMNIYTHERPRNTQEKTFNKEKFALAERIRATKELEISEQDYQLPQKSRSNKKDVYAVFDECLENLHQKGKESNKRLYRHTRSVLEQFCGEKRLLFTDLTPRFLEKFEAYLFERGCTGGGISAYMRTLRAVINIAIRDYDLNPDLYPFSTPQKKGYSISKLKSSYNPRALSMDDMEKIKNFPFEQYPHLTNTVLYFLFSYHARGMNFEDMARLKWSDIYDGRIKYRRQKTGQLINIKLSAPLQEVLNHFPKNDEPYIFPILSSFHQTPAQIKNRIQKCLKEYNKSLKEVAEVLAIDVKLTSYVARHTYATTLKNRGVDISVISEGMGHHNVEVTKHYLKQFSDDVLDKTDDLL